MKYVIPILLLASALFGFFCLNYTKAFGVDHHFEFAESTGLPAPAGWIYWMGILFLSIGSGLFGFLMGRRR